MAWSELYEKQLSQHGVLVQRKGGKVPHRKDNDQPKEVQHSNDNGSYYDTWWK